MLVYSIFELFNQAASSSGFIFCFCNLIIVIILMDLKPRLSFDEGSEIPVSVARRSQGENHKADENSKGVKFQKEEEEEEDREMLPDQKKEDEAAGNCSNEEDLMVEVEEEIPEKEDDDGGDEDELRRRVEEFIEKVNNSWKAEFLST